jgi:hypothetical protein
VRAAQGSPGRRAFFRPDRSVVANRDLETETTQIVRDMVSDGLVVAAVTRGKSLTDLLAARRPRITTAAAARAQRNRRHRS